MTICGEVDARRALYSMLLDEARQELTISLMGSPCGFVKGAMARNVYDHFVTIADDAARSAYVDGVRHGVLAGQDSIYAAALAPTVRRADG